MLAPQLPDSFRDMEPLFLAVICGCKAGLFHEALHEVYIPRIQRGNASFAGKVLGVRGALLSILVHFFDHGRWGSFLETGVPGQTLSTEDRLFILMQAALYLTATRGFGAPEARNCHEHAELLCRSLNRPQLLYSALTGQWRFCLITDKLSTTMQIAERVYALAQEQKNSALVIGGHRALAGTFYFMGDFESARQYAMRGVQVWRSRNVECQVQEVASPVVMCLCYQALSEWHFGEIASSLATMAETISLAKDLNDTQALAVALYFAEFLAYFERNPAEVERLASDLIELATRQNFAFFLPVGAVVLGWALSASGDTTEGLSSIEEGIRDYRATGATLTMPYLLAIKAEALYLAHRNPEALEAIKEAEALAERNEERCHCAEVYRLRGVFLAALGADETQIETSFFAAISTAKQQKSISLAARAEASYAQYRFRNRNR